jgi:O-antigen ligase
LGAIFTTLLMNGSVSPPYLHVSTLLIGLAVLPALALPVRNRRTRWAVRWTALCAALAGGWGLLQAVPLPVDWLAHPVWRDLPDGMAPARPTISAVPARTLAALPMLILPFLTFAAVLILGQSVRAAKRIWIGLAAVGFGLTLLGIALELFFPETLFFTTFAPVGGGAFNGIFVNRNVTASLTGMTAFAVLGVFYILRADASHDRLRWARPDEQASRRGIEALPLAQAATLLAVFICVIAIIATRSRAGTLLGLPFLTLAVITITQATTRRDGRARRRHLGPWKTAALMSAAALAVLVGFGEPVLARLDDQGTADLRICAWASAIDAFRDRPWTGTGFATFADLFPAYRDPDCIGTEGRWIRAHNTVLEFVMGFGVIAIVVLGLGYAVIGRLLWTGWTHRRSLRPIPVLAFAVLLFVTGHSLAAFPLQIPGLAIYAAALIGAGCAISVADHGDGSGRRRRRMSRGETTV